MAFLTPLYLLAGLAVGLPILFHLIRQTPKGRQLFSSLMFLEPSPPKITKRSRVEDWLLLLLRATAICLLALAFARPFFRSQAEAANEQNQGREIVILLDNSASMQREDLWERGIITLTKLIDQVEPADQVSLLTFDDSTSVVIRQKEWQNLEPSSRKKFVLETLEEIQPTDAGTNLGSAMIFAANHLQQKRGGQPATKRLMVISDFQTGSHWEELNGFTWPEDLAVWMMPVTAEAQTNATAHFVGGTPHSDKHLQVRVTNNSLSTDEQFQLVLTDEFSNSTDAPIHEEKPYDVYVSPGQSRVIQIPFDSELDRLDRLILAGDEQKFDNVSYFAKRSKWDVTVLFVGKEEQSGPDSLRFFLDPVFPSTANRNVEIVEWSEDDIEPPVDLESLSLVIIGSRLTEDQLSWTRTWLHEGGRAIFVARDTDHAGQLHDLIEADSLPIREADVVDYEMLQAVDLSHPVFSPFDDPRFADFSKLRFWRYREFDLSALPEAKVLASFESGSPAIFEIDYGKGKLTAFAAGWNRSDSDLAVWSKFVPMMNGLLEYLGRRAVFPTQYFVGDEIKLEQFRFDNAEIAIRLPNGKTISASQNDSLKLNAKGLYTFAPSEQQFAAADAIRIAVNIPPDESKTAPVSSELLLAAGVPIESYSAMQISQPANSQSTRQLMNQELESQQKLWKWILLAAITILFIETGLAAKRQKVASAATSPV